MSHSAVFLHSQEPKGRQRRHIFWRILKRTLLAFVVVLILIVSAATIIGVQIAAELFDGRDALVSARDHVLAFEMEDAQSAIDSAHDAFARADEKMNILSYASFIPVAGSFIEQATTLSNSSVEITQSLSDLLELSEDLMQLSGVTEEYLELVDQGLEPGVTFDDLSSDTKRTILERFESSADDLELLIERLKIVEAELQIVRRDSLLGPVASMADSLYKDIVQSEEYLELMAITASVLPQMAGVDGEKIHLLLFLNNNELRPGGGFIGSYGVLRLENGDIAQLETADVYTLDNAVQDELISVPPDALSRYNAAEKWFFRDSNWSPDFATSSLLAIERFVTQTALLNDQQREVVPSSARVDGVIALTPTYVSDLLRLLGDVTVSGQTFTPENVADLLEYQVEVAYVYEGLPPEQRKEILADLINEVKRRLFSLPLSELGTLIEITQKHLQNKQVAFYSSDQQIEEIFTRVGWGGRVLPETADVQMVVDANLASLKSDPVVKRTISYELGRSTTGDWVGRTTIQYNHTGSFDWKTTRYRTYARLYTPAGTQLVDVRGSLLNDSTLNPTGAEAHVDISEELGLTVFGTFTAIEPGESRQLIFEYLLSDQVVQSIENGSYDLTVLKQLGARDHALTLDLDFDKTVTHANPAEDSGQWGDDTYILNTILDQDLSFGVEF